MYVKVLVYSVLVVNMYMARTESSRKESEDLRGSGNGTVLHQMRKRGRPFMDAPPAGD
jgi:hypothetical protein